MLTKTIYATTRQGAFAKDFGLAGQIQRAAVSIMSNIAEGFERAGLKEFHRFLITAKSSCAEVRSHFYVALDIQCLSQDSFQKVSAQAQAVARIIGGLRISILEKMKNEDKKEH